MFGETRPPAPHQRGTRQAGEVACTILQLKLVLSCVPECVPALGQLSRCFRWRPLGGAPLAGRGGPLLGAPVLASTVPEGAREMTMFPADTSGTASSSGVEVFHGAASRPQMCPGRKELLPDVAAGSAFDPPTIGCFSPQECGEWEWRLQARAAVGLVNGMEGLTRRIRVGETSLTGLRASDVDVVARGFLAAHAGA